MEKSSHETEKKSQQKEKVEYKDNTNRNKSIENDTTDFDNISIKNKDAVDTPFTLTELTEKLKVQQQEAQRLLERATSTKNKSAIKFSTTAKLKAIHTLNEIKNNNTITASEVQKTASKIDIYLQLAQQTLQETLKNE